MSGPAADHIVEAAAETFDGVAVPPGRYLAWGAQRPRYRFTLGVLTIALAVATGAIILWDRATTKEAIYACPPECGRPPSSLPVGTMTRFTPADGGFSVGHPDSGVPDADGDSYQVTIQASGVTAVRDPGEGTLRLFGEPARGRAARDVIDDLMAKEFSGAKVAFEIPNATVGYQLGYGVVINIQRPGALTVSRAILMAAVKNDLALIATAEGPFRRFTPQFGPGMPSAANLEVAIDMGKYVDSFSWRGDPPR
jgi:hypothetical protein